LNDFTESRESDPQEFVRERRDDFQIDNSRTQGFDKLTNRFEQLKTDLKDRDIPSQETKDKMSNAWESTKDTAKDSYDNMKTYASNTINKTSDAIHNMKKTESDPQEFVRERPVEIRRDAESKF